MSNIWSVLVRAAVRNHRDLTGPVTVFVQPLLAHRVPGGSNHTNCSFTLNKEHM